MRSLKFIIILPLLCWSFAVRAQVSSMPDQWQLTLDVIKARAQSLLIENNGLKVEYENLTDQVKKLQQSINDQQYKNEQVNHFLKERHGRTDQQLRIEELIQNIKTKKQQAKGLDEQLRNLKKKQSALEHKIQLLKDRISEAELRGQEEKKKAEAIRNTVPPKADDQLAQLRKQLEEENRQEVLLGNEWKALKTGGKTQNLNVDAIDAQNKQLEAHLDNLRLQKLQYEKKFSDTQLARANGYRYEELKKRKDQLVANINAYEARLDELRESSLMALSWPLKKKKMVHQLVQLDAFNNQMRDKIKNLREDIDVLKDQVAGLERRVNFMQGKDVKQ